MLLGRRLWTSRLVWQQVGLAIMLVLALTSVLRAERERITFYVSPEGRDMWSGTRAAPARSGTDGPFATIAGARDAIRELKRRDEFPAGGVQVSIRGGLYFLTQTLELTGEDSGTEAGPVVYRAYRHEDVRLVGGKEITGFERVADPAILARLEEAARQHVLQIDLKAQGITDYGTLPARGFGRPIEPAALELFFQGRPMQLARWPNDDWAQTADVADRYGDSFGYEGDRPRRWSQAVEIWLHGYWTYDWADNYERVRSIDLESRTITTFEPRGSYGYSPGRRYYAFNILQELDAPGEHYLDRRTGILYFWPPAPLDEGQVFVSLLEGPMVSMQYVHHVSLEGLTFECSRGSGVVMVGGSSNLVAGCTFRNLGNVAVCIGADLENYAQRLYEAATWDRQGGTNNAVVACDIYQTGDGGIVLGGGDRRSLTPAGNAAINNHIWDYSRTCRTYRAAISVDGVGNRVAHNLIHDAPHTAVFFWGNDHLIEFNDVSRVCLESNDAGAIYNGRDFTQRGTIVRHNFIHELGSAQWVQSLYLDDNASGTVFYGNVVYKARGVVIGGGRDNVVANNIFVESHPAVEVGLRGPYPDFSGNGPVLLERLMRVNYQQPPYSERYPELVSLLEDQPDLPKGNRVERNINVGGSFLAIAESAQAVVQVRDNFTEGDPGLVNPAELDFRLRDDSPAYGIGFQQTPVERIGLIRDRYRPLLPAHP